MDRESFHALFAVEGPAVLPVVHVLGNGQAERNVRVALDAGCPGVFLINHDFPHEDFLPIIRHIREGFPALWLGVNFLAVTGKEAFPVLGRLQAAGTPVNAYWADDACIDERRADDDQVEAAAIDAARAVSGWEGLYFGGTAFKKQRAVAAGDYAASARIASRHMDVVTTSGPATGQTADIAKIETFRRSCGDRALALASGITPENAGEYAPLVDGFMVATGINRDGDFYNIDPRRLARLMTITAQAKG